MYVVLLTGEDLVNETQIVRDCTASISAACDSIANDSNIIKILIKVSSAGRSFREFPYNIAPYFHSPATKRAIPAFSCSTFCKMWKT